MRWRIYAELARQRQTVPRPRRIFPILLHIAPAFHKRKSLTREARPHVFYRGGGYTEVGVEHIIFSLELGEIRVETDNRTHLGFK